MAVQSNSSTTSIQLHRLCNSYSGEPLFTSDAHERDVLSKIGWTYEGGAWISPSVSNNPIFRLYNPHSGNHHFTASRNEYDTLGTIGWIREGLA